MTRPTDAEIVALLSSNLQMIHRLVLTRPQRRPGRNASRSGQLQPSLLQAEAASPPPLVERFLVEWLARRLPVPFDVCTTEQLHRAFSHWCDAEGELHPPPPQSTFTLAVQRWAAAQGDGSPVLEYRVVTLPAEAGALGKRHSVRCWLPLVSSGFQTRQATGALVKERIEAFEAALVRFQRRAKGGRGRWASQRRGATA